MGSGVPAEGSGTRPEPRCVSGLRRPSGAGVGPGRLCGQPGPAEAAGGGCSRLLQVVPRCAGGRKLARLAALPRVSAVTALQRDACALFRDKGELCRLQPAGPALEESELKSGLQDQLCYLRPATFGECSGPRRGSLPSLTERSFPLCVRLHRFW